MTNWPYGIPLPRNKSARKGGRGAAGDRSKPAGRGKKPPEPKYAKPELVVFSVFSAESIWRFKQKDPITFDMDAFKRFSKTVIDSYVCPF